MIHSGNLPKVLGDKFDPEARYVMVETHASGRGGRLPSRRMAQGARRPHPLGPDGSWQSLGEFSDPEIGGRRSYIIYVWRPHIPAPEGLGAFPKQEPTP